MRTIASRGARIRSTYPFQDHQCDNCSNVGICGGKLYCKEDPCDFLLFDMDEVPRFFAEIYPSVPQRFDLIDASMRVIRYSMICWRTSFSTLDPDTTTGLVGPGSPRALWGKELTMMIAEVHTESWGSDTGRQGV